MNILRFIKRTSFHLQKNVIGLLVYVNHRQYMRCYNSLLRRSGFNISGTPRFIAKSARFDDFDCIFLGDRTVISMNVHFLTHDYSYTTAIAALGERPQNDIGVKRSIRVGNNVFIGMNSILLPGTTIGNHVIIGAGSVVRGKIEDYSVVAGNPAVLIRDIREHAAKIKGRAGQDLKIDKD